MFHNVENYLRGKIPQSPLRLDLPWKSMGSLRPSSAFIVSSRMKLCSTRLCLNFNTGQVCSDFLFNFENFPARQLQSAFVCTSFCWIGVVLEGPSRSLFYADVHNELKSIRGTGNFGRGINNKCVSDSSGGAPGPLTWAGHFRSGRQ